MWLFNVRGNPADVTFNPVIVSYALVTVGDDAHPPAATIWVDRAKVGAAAAAHLAGLAELRPYSAGVVDIGAALRAAGARTVLLDTVSCNLAVRRMCDEIEIEVEEQVREMPSWPSSRASLSLL